LCRRWSPTANGALLVPHLAAGSGRATLLYGCYAMFGLSLVASLIIITMIWSRLAHHGSSGTTRVPTLWIVLGPLGQSMTAAALLRTNAHLAVAPVLASSMNTFAVLYAVPVFGFAFLWAGLAASLTIRTIRRGLPFALTWWSFTFPVGTCVTGITGLSLHTGLPAFRWAAVIAYAGLLTAWLTVGIRAARGSLSGDLLLALTTSGPPGRHQRLSVHSGADDKWDTKPRTLPRSAGIKASHTPRSSRRLALATGQMFVSARPAAPAPIPGV